MPKASLQFHHQSKKPQKFGFVIGIAILLTTLLVYALWPDEKEISPPKTPHIAAFGMPDWTEDELIKQELPDSSADLPKNEELKPDNPFLITGRVARNQTLFVALKNKGLDPKDIHPLIVSMSAVYDFKRSKPGDTYEVNIDEDKRILKFTYRASPEDIFSAQYDGSTYVASKVEVNKTQEIRYLSGSLQSSLYDSFRSLGESGELASHFMQLFAYDIDFGTDSQIGDKFELLVDKIYLDGKFYKYGKVWAASYESAGTQQTLEAFYFDDEKDAAYFNRNGQALKRSFLKTPVLGCTITSKYDLKRLHPILKRVRPHYGVDWAGPTGTPILAIADGVVTFAGWKGGNGYLLVIDHENGYSSLSAHLKGFPSGIKQGSRVKQGQVVAYLGNTGISTGPHLHFGMKKNGKYIDPLSIDSNYSYSLTGSALAKFQVQRDKLSATLMAGKTIDNKGLEEFIKTASNLSQSSN